MRHSVLVTEWQTIPGASGEKQNSEEEGSLWPGEIKESFLKEEAWSALLYILSNCIPDTTIL